MRRAIDLRIDGSDAYAIRICVRNEGAIPREYLGTIFEPFHLGSENRRSAQGLGLGLYIVKQFVEAHGGEVQVFSDEKEGTSFDVVMPRDGVGSKAMESAKFAAKSGQSGSTASPQMSSAVAIGRTVFSEVRLN